MNCSCAICCSRLEAVDDIFATQCGHIFHFTCLTQWLERSKTCPQCREKTSHTKIHRLYFNISNNVSILDDAATLQEKLDNLQFQMVLKEKDVTDFTKMAAEAQSQVVGLRKEVLKLEAEMEQKNSAMHALKQQVKHFKQISDDGLKYKKDAEKLKLKLSDLQDVQTILTATNDEADQLIENTEDPKKLAVYVSTLKRELTNGINNRKEHRQQIRQLREQLKQAQIGRHQISEQLKKTGLADSAMSRIQRENSVLKERLKAIDKRRTTSNTDTGTLMSPAKPEVKPIKRVPTNFFPITEPGSPEKNDEIKGDEENFPHWKCQAQNFMHQSQKKRVTRTSSSSLLCNSSVLTKKPRLSHDLMARTTSKDGSHTSDDLGSVMKIKRLASGMQKSQTSAGKTEQNDFFIDLT